MVPGESVGFCVSGPGTLGPVSSLCLPNLGKGEDAVLHGRCVCFSSGCGSGEF